MRVTVWIASLAVAGSLFAGQGAQMPSFADFDRDGDGKVTRQEFQKTQQERMEKRAAEGRAMRNAGNAPQFGDIDVNRDGVIDKNEFLNHQRSRMRSQGGGMGRGRF
ncbi:hypothetical protein NNO_1040 [Hydrogenimonas sp.]|nr:hypothetical protein NNO_1040 [Hydrogenimonas sp.]